MSKSKHNVIDPMQRAQTYTFDGLRYFLLREGTAHSDGSNFINLTWDLYPKYIFDECICTADYSDVKLMRILNSELADTLGNLLSRGCAKTVNKRQVFPKHNRRVFEEELLTLDVTRKLGNLIEQLPGSFHP